MKTRRPIQNIVTIASVLFMSAIVCAAETDAQRIARETREAADRAVREAEKKENKYEVKKPSDDHIVATEKAAADVEKRKTEAKEKKGK